MADVQLFINGEFTDSVSGETFPSTDPASGKEWVRVAKGGREDAIRAIEAARKACDEGPWPRMSGKQRAEKLNQIAEGIGNAQQKIADNEVHDGGGTMRKAMLADVPGAQATFQWFAQCAETEPEITALEGSPFPPSENYVRREPYGVTTGVIPWNFPLLMAGWKIAPSIAAGNCCVIKPASFTSVTALDLARVIQEVDLPPGVVNVIAGPGGTVGEELASNPMVDKTAFTGSTEVGRRIMQLASATVKAVTLELGGKSANIVLDDADLDIAAAGVLWGTFMHNGQVCESGTRALVHRAVYDEFLSMLVDRAGKMTIGNPMDFGTDLGPLVSRQQVETVERYVALGKDEGAKLVCGGSKPDALGDDLDRDAFYNPTIFADVENSSRLAQEEIFGPVLSVIPIDDDEQAVRIANDSIYGLGGGVWSADVDRAKEVAHGMRTGTVWINDYHLIDAKRPFGGYKQSGVGRELGTFGYEAYRQVKHVHVNPQPGRDGHVHYQMLSANI
jgi:acyl-CoA reductase-like NAD-dependent aldehyde dehydrogenase